MRIITGIYKGRRFDVPRTFKARPTTDFAKENLFNVLRGYVDFEGSDALDLFAGTGSITAELLSRECATVTSVEMDREHFAYIQGVIRKLGARNCRLLRGDVLRFLHSGHRQFDIVFADPPYQMPELPQLPRMVAEAGIVRKGGVFVLEHGKTYDFSTLPGFFDHRAYGSVNFSFFHPAEAAEEQSGATAAQTTNDD